MSDQNNSGCAIIAYVAFFVAGLAGWIHHLVICFTEREWGFLIAGALYFPVAVIHGWGRWFGWW